MAETSLKTVEPWSFMIEKGQNITKIMVKHDVVVDGIGFDICDEDGELIITRWYEGTGGKPSPKIDEVALSDDDFLTHVSGTYGTHLNELCITTMTIHTNLFPGGHGLYGEPKEPSLVTPFSSPLPFDGSIVGFFGCTENFLGSIGIHALGSKIELDGPYGDIKSKVNWYIKLKDGDYISKLIIKNAFLVDGFVFEVTNNNTGITYTQDFSGPGERSDTITFEKDEVITKIIGSYGTYNDNGIKIATITIYTNLHPEGIGPFGTEDEVTETESFEHEVPLNTSIAGFYGSYGLFLNSIGFSDEIKEEHHYGPYGRVV